MLDVPLTIPDVRGAHGGPTYELRSPVDGSHVATVADNPPEAVDVAVARARGAAEALERMTSHERADLCHRIADAVMDRIETLAAIVAWETGRTVASGRDEVMKAASGFRLAAEEAVRLTGDVVPVRDATKLTFTTHHPTGVWAVLSPWNFPLNIPVEYIGPALATGNPVVWKPAPATAACAHHLVAAMETAGLPEGAVTLLTTERIDTAEALVRHPDVVGIGLTGSSPTGRAVAQAAAGKELIMELGGNGPIIVYGDADLERAAQAIATSSFAASGQICSSGGRALVAPGIADDLAERVAARAADFRLGNPFEEGTVIGPLQNTPLAERVRAQIRDAVSRGARVITEPTEKQWPTANYVPATVVADVPLGAPLEAEETFGPVAPIVPVDEDDLITVANHSAHALSVAVFTQDVDRALQAAHQLRFGSVVVNDRSSFWELHLPFGGWTGRESGTGRVGVPHVVRRMTQLKTVSLTRTAQ